MSKWRDFKGSNDPYVITLASLTVQRVSSVPLPPLTWGTARYKVWA